MKLNIKLKEIFFLSILLLLLPAMVNAEDADSLNSDLSHEATFVEYKTSQETKVDTTAEEEKTKTAEDNQDTKSNETIENPKENQAVIENNLSQDTKANGVIDSSDEKQEALKNDEEEAPKNSINTSGSEELEIREEKTPEALRGGEPIGYDGGGISYGPEPGFFIIKKDENGKPMRVAFKITNLITGETHILVTDSEGRTNELLLNGKNNVGKNQEVTTRDDIRYTNIRPEDIERIVKELQRTKEIIDPEGEKPDIFPGASPFPGEGPGVPPPPGEGPGAPPPPDGGPNANDIFLGKRSIKDLYEFENLKSDKNTKTIFHKNNLGRGSLKVRINFDKVTETNNVTTIDSAIKSITIDYGDLPEEKFNQVDDFKIMNYAKKLLAYELIKSSNGETIEYPDEYQINIIVERTQKANVDDIYKVEELRTKTNKGYSLKTFYIKRAYQEDWQKKGNDADKRYEFLMGYSEDKITEQAQIQDLGKCPPPIEPGGGVNLDKFHHLKCHNQCQEVHKQNLNWEKI